MANMIPGPDPFIIDTDGEGEQSLESPTEDDRPPLERRGSSAVHLAIPLPPTVLPGVTDVSLFLPIPIASVFAVRVLRDFLIGFI